MQQIANRGGTIVRIKPLTLESGSVESNLGDREWDRDAVEEVKGEELGVTETQPTLITSQPIISEVTPITPQPETTQGQNPESSAWWVEISTTQPQVIYYFGPFDSFEEAKDFQGGYIEDLEEEGAIGITVEIKWCSPDNLTIF
ncbi:MAG TPA: hypothetical protein DEG17_19000 [Cyanobacteria bacterium UBA11149]|nr:hypothetical protein [Cyanobacteria bacterium UBA11367]HBE56211.1 hypothetical protein [Cyanobacteria bacterium UBA11366]HBK66007.1 hypothetical protein [Cyanobacteria bacterium UBA11166]HBR74721.1 hypothetical protein [Cyanobacteria bacterium UBA11159]HBS70321.1 hypothetical protein [Cyanobacteria bacterium UBA11153]HBW90899.1 hypothetical protein [Cyanobacteria bacterium UBA11149]HCA96749.1 hypothetical protein [Cyanobacteria bacterium UBA9226]